MRPIQNEMAKADNPGPHVADGRVRARRRVLQRPIRGTMASSGGGVSSPTYFTVTEVFFHIVVLGNVYAMPDHIGDTVRLSPSQNMAGRG